MKRRNVDSSKTRRPVKKIPKSFDGIYTSIVVYVKLVLLWFCVMGGDYVLEFRLEYLYPIYLLLHNSYEAYKFQGIAFAVLLVCVVVSVDVICLGVIPTPWLYLLGSLAVWGQWSFGLTPLGPLLLLPTLVYIDGKSIRPLPTQPLSPLAAHCVGFPLVSLGFGLKSFLGGRLKQRTRNDVGRQNEVLYSILWDALPFTSTPVNNNEVIKNGEAVLVKKQQSPSTPAAPRRKSIEVSDGDAKMNGDLSPIVSNHHHNGKVASGTASSSGSVTNPSQQNSNHHHNHHQNHNSSSHSLTASLSSPGSNNSSSHHNNSSTTSSCPTCTGGGSSSKKKKDDCCFKLESEVRKLRSDLHVVRTIESELRGQIGSLLSSERNLRGDIASLQGEHESLQLKYSALLLKSQEERQGYEKKLMEERRQKENAITKQKKASQECSGDCKRKLRDAERDKDALKRDIKLLEEKNVRIERELQNVKSTLMLEQKNKESSADTARLMSHLTTLKEQNAHLESSLNAETRLKLDLFSALGEARRQLSIRDSMIKSKEDELDEVRSQLVEVLAVSDFSNHHQQRQHLQQQQQQQQHQQSLQQLQPRQLQPNHHSMSQQPQQQHSNRLKNLVVGVGEGSPQQGRDNLTFSPLIES